MQVEPVTSYIKMLINLSEKAQVMLSLLKIHYYCKVVKCNEKQTLHINVDGSHR